MPKHIFIPGEILLPAEADMHRWSVIACDQFTSQPEYWQQVERLVGDAPSTLRLMLPEAYLETRDCADETRKINQTMRDYLDSGLFRKLDGAYVYLERTQADGSLRRGLVGLLDLEEYSYSPGTSAAVRPTENTVESRLPPRVAVRQEAVLEMPHVVVFIDDAEETVIEPLAALADDADLLYDFDLMQGSGHVKGWSLTGDKAAQVQKALDALGDAETLERKYGALAGSAAIFAMGDGNHSLATAKLCWERLKEQLSPAELENHPARYSLVEISNIHESSILFEPIHRVVFETESAGFAEGYQTFLTENADTDGDCTLRVVTGAGETELCVQGYSLGGLVGATDRFITAWLEKHGGAVDYVHGDADAAELGRKPGSAAILLPALNKAELFSAIMKDGVYPKKSFSIGHAADKRFYLECRKITK